MNRLFLFAIIGLVAVTIYAAYVQIDADSDGLPGMFSDVFPDWGTSFQGVVDWEERRDSEALNVETLESGETELRYSAEAFEMEGLKIYRVDEDMGLSVAAILFQDRNAYSRILNKVLGEMGQPDTTDEDEENLEWHNDYIGTIILAETEDTPAALILGDDTQQDDAMNDL